MKDVTLTFSIAFVDRLGIYLHVHPLALRGTNITLSSKYALIYSPIYLEGQWSLLTSLSGFIIYQTTITIEFILHKINFQFVQN